jgi:hypothetical protein
MIAPTILTFSLLYVPWYVRIINLNNKQDID